MGKNYLNTPVGNDTVDALRNKARRAAIKAIQVERWAMARDYNNMALDKAEAAQNASQDAWWEFRKAHKALIS